MATTTPNYGWPVPTSTDYVKDGALAIETLGDAIDATVFGLPTSAAGLTLIKTQTIGTAVTSVNVTSAFSATYDNYKIIISGGAGSANNWITLKLGATVTGYYWAISAYTYANGAASVGAGNQALFNRSGYHTTNTIAANYELINPFNARETVLNYLFNQPTTNGEGGIGAGYIANNTSYTDFTIAPTSGTLTGGTIYVYGYNK